MPEFTFAFITFTLIGVAHTIFHSVCKVFQAHHIVADILAVRHIVRVKKSLAGVRKCDKKRPNSTAETTVPLKLLTDMSVHILSLIAVLTASLHLHCGKLRLCGLVGGGVNELVELCGALLCTAATEKS